MHRARRGIQASLAALAIATGCSKDASVADVLVVSRVEITPPNGAIVLGQNLQLAATPLTEGGIPLPSRIVTWSSSNLSIATVTAEGVVHAQSVGGPVRILATVDGVSGETQITVVSVPIDHVVVTPPSTSILLGQTSQLVATAFDAAGTVLIGRPFQWNSSAPATVAVTSTGLVIGMGTGGPISISASAEGKTASASVTVAARPATRFGWIQQPTSAKSGVSIAPAIKIAIQDDLLATVTSATNTVTIALASNPGNGVLSGTRTVAAVNGIATFSNLSVDRTGTSYTLLATAPGLTETSSTPFTITAGGAAQLVFATAPPTTARSGAPFSVNPVVQARDAAGNVVGLPSISITVTSAPGGVVLGGTTVVATTGNGTATFAGLSLTGQSGSYALTFTAPGIPPLVSAPISVTAGPTSLAIVTQPSATVQFGVAFPQQPVIEVKDAAGNPVAGVTVTVGVMSGGGVLAGPTTSSSNAAGRAVFTGLSLSGKTGAYVLTFSAAPMTPVASTPITLTAGPPVQISILSAPSSNVKNGEPFPLQPVIQLLDSGGNGVPGIAVLATLNSCTGLSAGTLGGTASVQTDANGSATYSGLRITIGLLLLPANCTLRFAAGNLGVTSGTITVSP